MKALIFSLLFSLLTTALKAQFIIAGQHNATDYYVNIPDTTLGSCPFCPALHFPIDINGDGIIDFTIDAFVSSALGAGIHYSGITAKNNNKIVNGYLDSCFAYDGHFVQTYEMTRALHINDSINKNNNWTHSGATLFLAYGSWLGFPPGGYSCSDNSFSSSGANYLGVCVFLPADTIFGWIKVGGVASNSSCTVYEYACSSNRIGIENLPYDGSINIYPNPVSSMLTFVLSPNAEVIQLELISTLGQVVYKRQFLSDQKHEVDLNELSRGMYIVKLYNDTIIIQKKIIKQ